VALVDYVPFRVGSIKETGIGPKGQAVGVMGEGSLEGVQGKSKDM
jgi:hypothetical protein